MQVGRRLPSKPETDSEGFHFRRVISRSCKVPGLLGESPINLLRLRHSWQPGKAATSSCYIRTKALIMQNPTKTGFIQIASQIEPNVFSHLRLDGIFDHVGFPGECWLQISETIPLFAGRCVRPGTQIPGQQLPLWIINHSLFGGAARTRRLCGSTDLLRPCKCTSPCNPKPCKSSLSVVWFEACPSLSPYSSQSSCLKTETAGAL